ncbi:hypothetical protein RB614_23205 [Phytohabitans sp. ZYX-F-186]|uniref:Uncharacterized protein n=1 Tax=Phytohabitans maris TaxID=3071409 RepID=A0ABU0ZMC9_9ACTN|nr:hypothetical protein [Phytohabitans sp. ZYX-F-186]MDQ7907430.1 hypothetical protein [Phytohabitans sp. ZYX-F-186]
MSVLTEVAPMPRERTGLPGRTAIAAADVLAWAAPVAGSGRLAQFFYDRRDSAVWIIVLVAVAVVIAVGLLAWAYAYCVNRGGSFDGGLSVSYPNPFTARLRFKCQF